MKTKLLFLSILFLATNLFASEGFYAFSLCRVCSPVVFEHKKTGIIDSVSSTSVGTVDFTFTEEQPDVYYEIQVSSDDPQTFNTEIRSRATTGFTLSITQDSSEFDPNVVLIVAVDR